MPDAFDQIAAEMGLDAPTPEAAPAPAPAAESAAAPPAEPSAPAQPPAVEAPPAAGAPAPTTEPPYMRVLADQNRQLTATLQQMAENQKLVADRLLQQSQPTLTKEEREAQIQQAFVEFNRDPMAFIQAQVAAETAKVREEMAKQLQGFTPRNPAAELDGAVRDQMQRAAFSPSGATVRPEVLDPAFQQIMLSKQVSDKVYADYFAEQAPADVIKNPVFYVEAYHLAKQIQAAAPAVAANNQQSAQDLQSQRAVIQGHGSTVAPGGKAPSGAGAPVDPVAALLAQMRESGSAQDMLHAAFDPKK